MIWAAMRLGEGKGMDRDHFIVVAVMAGVCALGCQAKLDGDEAYAKIDEILAKYERIEGHTHKFPHREQCLQSLAAREDIERMAEIGFNAGHSTVSLLAGNSSKTLTSFDLCSHAYYEETSSFMLKNYEGQLEIICGDSTETLPQFLDQEPLKYDFIHIDGGHQGDVPRQDTLNSLLLSHDDTFILLDDCNEVQQTEEDGWIGRDVNRAWARTVREGLIEPVSFGTCNIGNCLGKPAKKARAASRRRLAAEQGDAGAQYALGVMYANGRGVPQDHVRAHMWANLAAAQGQDEDHRETRELIAEMMTPAQIAEAQKLAREWLAEHSQN